MSTFSLGDQSAAFLVTEEGFEDRAWIVEELTLGVIVPDPTTWGALFSLVTPKEQTSVRLSKAQDGQSTVVIDIGGGAGVGHLDLSDAGLDSHDALLIDLTSEAPIGSPAPRRAKATFWLIPGT